MGLKTAKELDQPLRMLFTNKRLFNGIGSYSACEFLEKWYELTGSNFASPVSCLKAQDMALADAFVVMLHKFEYQRRKWLKDNFITHGFSSGLRPNEWWEEHWLKRHVKVYRAAGSMAYEIHTPFHRMRAPLTYSKYDFSDDPRVLLHKRTSCFTTNSLTVGGSAFMTGKEKARFDQERTEYSRHRLPVRYILDKMQFGSQQNQ